MVPSLHKKVQNDLHAQGRSMLNLRALALTPKVQLMQGKKARGGGELFQGPFDSCRYTVSALKRRGVIRQQTVIRPLPGRGNRSMFKHSNGWPRLDRIAVYLDISCYFQKQS